MNPLYIGRDSDCSDMWKDRVDSAVSSSSNITTNSNLAEVKVHNVPLIKLIEESSPHVSVFLYSTGLLWPNSNELTIANILICLSCLFIRSLPIAFIGLTIVILYYYPNQATIIIGCVLLSQILSLFPAARVILQRLQTFAISSSTFSSEINHFNKSIFSCWMFLITSILSGLVIPIIDLVNVRSKGDQLSASIVLCQVIVSASMLSVALLFISVDAKVSKSLIEELIICADQKTITYVQFISVKQDVDRRVNESALSNGAAVFVAVLNIAVLVIVCYFGGFVEVFIYLSLFYKEFLFIAIIFWEASKVNELSDQLTLKLACDAWDIEDTMKDLSRVRIYMSSYTKPISFSLFGYRYKKIDVIIQLGSVIISMLFILFKQIITQVI